MKVNVVKKLRVQVWPRMQMMDRIIELEKLAVMSRNKANTIRTVICHYERICSTKGMKISRALILVTSKFDQKFQKFTYFFRKKRQGGKAVPGLANIVKGAKKGVNRGKARNKKGSYKSKANSMQS